MIYRCCDELRRNAVAAHPTLNGIDFLEVLDRDAPTGSPRQQTLLVRLLKLVPAFGPENVRIEGGERVRPVSVVWVAPASAPPAALTTAEEQAFFTAQPEADRLLLVRTDSAGDFSTYRLRLVRSLTDDAPPDGFDPLLVEVDFSFKVECPSPFDCQPGCLCHQDPTPAPEIDYLARDYGSFRRLLLDRLSQLVPGWRERSAADLGVTLAELLAYVGDHLSYWQDAVATEAYLETARRRTSLRRHALLVDYRMHEGCNARTWVHLRVSEDGVPLSMTDTRFYSRVPGAPPRIAPGSREDELALGWRPEIFEPLQDAILFQAHNELQFHTWGDRRCCLPAGATRATLRGHLPNLQPGDVLIFEEVRGPKTGQPGDADPQHRHAVRLASVTAFTGAVPLTDPLTDEQITEIAWTAEDALPFPLCISAVLDEDAGGGFADGISVARGNVVLADHGVTVAGPPLDPSALPPEWLDFIALHGLVVTGEPLPPVPYPRLFLPPEEDCACEPVRPVPFPPRYRPRLRHGPLTHAGTVMKTIFTGGQKQRVRLPFDPQGSAAAALRWAMRDVVPRITLIEENAGPPPLPWEARRHLLASAPSAREFVAEVEHDGTTYLRFGDDTNGKRPDSGALFSAIYRVGSGRAGNVGADALAHVVAADARILEARNPLPGQGGRDPETPAEVRRRAPRAFRTQQRAVTPEDYQNVAERHPQVQRAAATLRWTGSWHTVFLTVDRTAGAGLEPAFRAELREHVEPFRMAGQDLKFDAPAFVSLEIEMVVCVAPGYFRGQVRAALLEVFSSGLLPDGRRAVFHPDNFTFGQTVYLSPLYAAARSVAGVDSVEIVTFQRQGVGDPQYLLAGKMTLGRLEIARLENDPNFPEHGVLRLTLHGGH